MPKFYKFLLALYEARAVVPPTLSFMYAFGTILLQVLNCVWYVYLSVL